MHLKSKIAQHRGEILLFPIASLTPLPHPFSEHPFPVLMRLPGLQRVAWLGLVAFSPEDLLVHVGKFAVHELTVCT